jgi:hypothetical protein
MICRAGCMQGLRCSRVNSVLPEAKARMGFARLFRPRYARARREHWGTHRPSLLEDSIRDG